MSDEAKDKQQSARDAVLGGLVRVAAERHGGRVVVVSTGANSWAITPEEPRAE